MRERFAAMCDPGTFQEIGSTSGVGSYDEDGRLVGFQPANLLCGVADVDEPALRRLRRRLHGAGRLLGGDDPREAGLRRADRHRAGPPHIRLVDGMGGGGSVKDIETKGHTYVPKIRAGSRW